MIIIPDTPPVIDRLNSYYLVFDRLVEHYQGELGSGAIHLLAPTAEAIVYFDPTGAVGGAYRDPDQQIAGTAVLSRLPAALERYNFTVSVYPLDLAMVHFWSRLPEAETLYQGLSTEFTDLDGLVKKMRSEQLTGYIDVALNGTDDACQLFFSLGKFIGGRYSWRPSGGLSHSPQSRQELLARVRQRGGIFNVRRIDLTAPAPEAAAAPAAPDSSEIIVILEELLSIAENTVHANRRIRSDFQTLLKKKFVQNAERYEFLDPFAAEFDYRDGRITFNGETPDSRLAEGVTTCVRELADDLRLGTVLRDNLRAWQQRFAAALTRMQIRI